MFPENKYQEENQRVTSKLTQTSSEIFPFPSSCATDPVMLPSTPRPPVGVSRFTDTLSPIPLQIPGSVVELDELWEDPLQIYEAQSLRNNNTGYCWVRPYKSGPVTPEPFTPYDRLPKCHCGLYTFGDRHTWMQSQTSHARTQSKRKRPNHRHSEAKPRKKSISESMTSLYRRVLKKSMKIYENFMDFLGIDVIKKNNFSDGHSKKRKHQDWFKQSNSQRTWI